LLLKERMQRMLAAANLMVLLGLGAAGQDAFEVASIRVNRSRDRGSMELPKGGQRFTATNMPLAPIILVAYGITVCQSGSDPLLTEEMRRMLQATLAEPFHLAVRRETREGPVYALTVARGGPKLHHSSVPEDELARPRTPATGDRVVVDRTGLSDRYDFELTFERDSDPSIFTALQEQLGLKLESTKAPVKFLVVEHVERPAEN
jgi:hypothetical protein